MRLATCRARITAAIQTGAKISSPWFRTAPVRPNTAKSARGLSAKPSETCWQTRNFRTFGGQSSRRLRFRAENCCATVTTRPKARKASTILRQRWSAPSATDGRACFSISATVRRWRWTNTIRKTSSPRVPKTVCLPAKPIFTPWTTGAKICGLRPLKTPTPFF